MWFNGAGIGKGREGVLAENGHACFGMVIWDRIRCCEHAFFVLSTYIEGKLSWCEVGFRCPMFCVGIEW